jgi:hypothetical protein
MRQFFTVWYDGSVVITKVLPVETPIQQVREMMIETNRLCPGLHSVHGCSGSTTEVMILRGEMRTYPIHHCQTPACQVCR